AYCSITLSPPRWLAQRWYERYGFEATETWLQFNNQPAPVTLRTNRIRTTTAALTDRLTGTGVRVRPGTYAPDALIVEEGNPLRARSDAVGRSAGCSTSRLARPRHLRVAGRQDHGHGCRHGIPRTAGGLRRARSANRAAPQDRGHHRRPDPTHRASGSIA